MIAAGRGRPKTGPELKIPILRFLRKAGRAESGCGIRRAWPAACNRKGKMSGRDPSGERAVNSRLVQILVFFIDTFAELDGHFVLKPKELATMSEGSSDEDVELVRTSAWPENLRVDSELNRASTWP